MIIYFGKMLEVQVEQNTDINDIPNKEYKTKDYVRRAINNYRNKRYNVDDEYRKKQIETSKQHYQENKEKYKEYKKLYMRSYRARKKENTEKNSDIPLETKLNELSLVENNTTE